MLTLDSFAEFVWGFGQDFLLTIQEDGVESLYVWSDPDYNGDNTIRPYYGDPNNFTSPGFCGRDKGIHRIRDYCGKDVKILDCCPYHKNDGNADKSCGFVSISYEDLKIDD